MPKEITEALDPIKVCARVPDQRPAWARDAPVARTQDDDALVKQYGIDLCIQMCRKLLANGVKGLHFYTLNLERSVVKILEGLQLIAVEHDHVKGTVGRAAPSVCPS